MRKIILSFLGLSFVFFAPSCKKKDDGAPAPQEKTITTVSLILKEEGTLVDTFSFRDPDGPGLMPPTAETLTLGAGKTYTCTLLLLDETKNPADTVSLEIEKEKDDYQFFYDFASAERTLTIHYADYDSHFMAVGLQTMWVATTASTGKLKIYLKHQPGIKPTAGEGDWALGETDVEVEFDAIIQ